MLGESVVDGRVRVLAQMVAVVRIRRRATRSFANSEHAMRVQGDVEKVGGGASRGTGKSDVVNTVSRKLFTVWEGGNGA
jgi:hypothetical protein